MLWWLWRWLGTTFSGWWKTLPGTARSVNSPGTWVLILTYLLLFLGQKLKTHLFCWLWLLLFLILTNFINRWNRWALVSLLILLLLDNPSGTPESGLWLRFNLCVFHKKGLKLFLPKSVDDDDEFCIIIPNFYWIFLFQILTCINFHLQC